MGDFWSVSLIVFEPFCILSFVAVLRIVLMGNWCCCSEHSSCLTEGGSCYTYTPV